MNQEPIHIISLGAAVVTFLLLGSMVTGAALVGHEEDEQ